MGRWRVRWAVGNRGGPGPGPARGTGSGDGPGPVGAGQAVLEQGAQVKGGAAGAQPGVVLGGAVVAQLDPAPVLGGHVRDGAFDGGAGGVVLLELCRPGLDAGGAQEVLVGMDGHRP